MEPRFEWDDDKAEKNLKKHSVSFVEAIQAFDDPHGVEVYDEEHSSGKEKRFGRIAHSTKRLLFVVFTIEEDTQAVRIISAKKAERKHEQTYEEAD